MAIVDQNETPTQLQRRYPRRPATGEEVEHDCPWVRRCLNDPAEDA